MQKIKKFLLNRSLKAIVDILLIAGIFISIVTSRDGSASWGSFHCIANMTWYLLMLVHLWQHWRMTIALVKPKVMKRNKITFIALAMFILMTFSIVLFVFNVNEGIVNIHHKISHVFIVVMIVHSVQKIKRFIKLLK